MPTLPCRQHVVPWALALAFVGLAGSRDVYWTGDFFDEALPA